MLQAIMTKYIGPSNVRGARVKAVADAGSVILSWDHRLNAEDNHKAAAAALADKFGWLDSGRFRIEGGGLHRDASHDYCFVLVKN